MSRPTGTRTICLAEILIVLLLGGCSERYTSMPVSTMQPTTATAERPLESPSPTIVASAESSDQLSKGPILAITANEGDAFFLLDTTTKAVRRVGLPKDSVIRVLGWVRNGCELLVRTQKSRILQVDLHGNILQETISLENLTSQGSILDEQISPDLRWIAYIRGTGYHGYASYEYQNVESLLLDNGILGPIHLTEKGESSDFAWAPSGELIAYSDADARGMTQLFVSKPDGTGRSQLTDFAQQDAEIRSLAWTPDGKRLAFVRDDKESDQSIIMIVNPDVNNGLTTIPNVIRVNNLWWADNTLLVADVVQEDRDQDLERSLAWFDGITGDQAGSFAVTSAPHQVIDFPGPLNQHDKIGFFSIDGFYVLDMATRLVEKNANYAQSGPWTASPTTFNGEQSCP